MKEPEKYRDLVLPKFQLMFAGTTYLNVVVKVGGEWYQHKDHPCPLNTLHVYGEKDPFQELCIAESKLFTPLFEVIHEEGHKVPKDFSPDALKVISEFIRLEYFMKNSVNAHPPPVVDPFAKL